MINIAVGLAYQKDGIGGRVFVYFLWCIWWIIVALSFLCAFVMVHVMLVPALLVRLKYLLNIYTGKPNKITLSVG